MAALRTMRAVQYDKYGGGAEGLKHVEVSVPSPKKGEVLLKMEAASINPIDWKIQKGMLRPFLPASSPSRQFQTGKMNATDGPFYMGTTSKFHMYVVSSCKISCHGETCGGRSGR